MFWHQSKTTGHINSHAPAKEFIYHLGPAAVVASGGRYFALKEWAWTRYVALYSFFSYYLADLPHDRWEAIQRKDLQAFTKPLFEKKTRASRAHKASA